jgi:Glycosyl hydrolases family 16/Calx-beta domain
MHCAGKTAFHKKIFKSMKVSIINSTLIFSLLGIATSVFGCLREDDGTAAERDLPTISIANQSVPEGDIDQTIQIEVLLSGENRANAVVKFAAVNSGAEALTDFEVLTASPLIFAPGEVKKIIEVKIKGDEVIETKEAFQLKFYNPLNVKLANDVAYISIEDDDDNASGLAIPSGGFVSPNNYQGYNLVWADEFDDATLNLNSWSYELGAGGWGNNELQHYREDNTAIVDGHLVITAKKQNFGSSNYTSSRLVTKGKKIFKFGRIDIRAALPKGQGLWPALWMLGSNIDAVSWPACGEIDIMELTGNLPNRVLGTAHFGANTSQHQQYGNAKYLSGTDNFHDKFHVFSINWEVDKIEFYVDNELFHSLTPANMNGATYPFNKPFFFIFNVAVGGNLPGPPDATTAFPQRMIVDYVRVFQK